MKTLRLYLTLVFIFTTCFSCSSFAGSPGNSPGAEEKTDKSFQVKYYPNPASKTLNIDLAFNQFTTGQTISIEVKFLNLLGKEMKETYTFDANSLNNHFELDIENLASGVYFMEISATNSGSTTSLTKRITKL